MRRTLIRAVHFFVFVSTLSSLAVSSRLSQHLLARNLASDPRLVAFASPWDSPRPLDEAVLELSLGVFRDRRCIGVVADDGADEADSTYATDLDIVTMRLHRGPYVVRVFRMGHKSPEGRVEGVQCENLLVFVGPPLVPERMRHVVEGSLGLARYAVPNVRCVFVFPPMEEAEAVVRASVLLEALGTAIMSTMNLNAVALIRSPAPKGHRRLYDIYDFPVFDQGCDNTTARLVATWHPLDGVNLAAGRTAIFEFGTNWRMRHIKLRGSPLRVGFRNASNFLMASMSEEGSWQLHDCIARMILDACERTLNFKARLELTWEEAGDSDDFPYDVLLIPGVLTDEWNKSIGTECGWYTDWCFTFAVPIGSDGWKPVTHKLTGPLQGMTWVLVFSSIALAWLASRLLACASSRLLPGLHWGVLDTHPPLSLIYCSLIGVPATPLPKGTALRTFISFWLYFGLVVTTGYLAALKSIVAAPPMAGTINTVDQLAESDLPVYAPGFAAHQVHQAAHWDEAFAQISPRTVVKEPRELHQAITASSGLSVGILNRKDLIETHRRMTVSAHGFASLPGPHSPGALHIFQNYCFYTQFAFPFLLPRGSPLVPALRRVLHAVFESGLSSYWTDFYNKEDEMHSLGVRELLKKVQPWHPLTVNHLRPVFTMFLFALLIPSAVLVLELLADWATRRDGWRWLRLWLGGSHWVVATLLLQMPPPLRERRPSIPLGEEH